MVNFRAFALFLLIATSSGNATAAFLTGVCFHPDRMKISASETLQKLHKYQFSSYRTDLRWREIEKKEGVYKLPYENLKFIIDGSLKVGIIPIVILGSANPLYGDSKPVTDEQVHAFTRYVEWVVNQYPHENIIYEIYNEWWHDDFKSHPESNDALSAKKYARLIKEVSAVIRKNNPRATIIAGSLNPLALRQVKWLDSMIKDGILTAIDGISIHPYSTNFPIMDFSAIDLFSQHLTAMNDGKQVNIFITEMGYSNSLRGKLSPSQQENYTQQYFKMASERDYIKGLWWYSLTDEKSTDTYESNFGLLDNNGIEKDIIHGYLSWLNSKK
ncbi:cellulase family glycosylhydrolase [Erwinia rhapontici]|uniref:cellulase family glycosylhydrolase n=2 Tax=Erwinia TaxID=551 RepID=UPI001331678C|nr:cellulase family glycosylhydrolase [Erwinia rhapontici]MBP2156287.1 hypothetical protein [Erwinia rhapontici]NKG30033.1 glycoside hydrolase family 5 protein [Erwinia rhapontici]